MGLPQANKSSMTSGHQGYLPTPLSSGSQNVFINGMPQVTQGSVHAPHIPAPLMPPEGPRIMGSGSQSVFVNGMGLNRIGDQTECGAFVITQSTNVFIG